MKPPTTLHAFRASGDLQRDAAVTLTWRDATTAAFTVGGLADGPVVLVATIAPGVVLRALVAPGAAAPRIDAASEARLAADARLAPVGAAGIASVVRQGGLEPIEAGRLHGLAAERLQALATTRWGRPRAGALRGLARALDAQAAAQGRYAVAIAEGHPLPPDDLVRGEMAIAQALAAVRRLPPHPTLTRVHADMAQAAARDASPPGAYDPVTRATLLTRGAFPPR